MCPGIRTAPVFRKSGFDGLQRLHPARRLLPERTTVYTLHFFSTEELCHFFALTDQCHYSSECPYRYLIMPVLFRIIYLCGLRGTEARLLKVGGVDLNMGVLSIQHSKKDNNRLVPMSDSLVKRYSRYSVKVRAFAESEYW